MATVEAAAAACFWTCAGLVLYAYMGYPILIWLLAWAFGREAETPAEPGDADLPDISMIIAAADEEAVIGDRLRDALALDYPKHKLEIIVGSDGSNDRTAEVVREFTGRGVRLLDFASARGKAAVVNDAARAGRGEILLMTDANTRFNSAAVRKLVRWFQDPKVGVVVGRLVLEDPLTGRNADGLYWKYETFLKRREGRLGALLGANGAIYVMRKELYEPIPAGTIVDDFVIPLLARLRTGRAIVYDPDAVAFEEAAPDVGAEFHRRVRIGAGGFQSLLMLWKLFDPRLGWIAFAFLSHKVLRWICPFFLIVCLSCSLLLREDSFYCGVLSVQVGFYLASLLAAFAPARRPFLKPLRLALMFTSMNAALLVGFMRWILGIQGPSWRRTTRDGEAGKAG